MSVRLPKELSQDATWKTITLSSGQALEICVRRPDFKDQVISLAARSLVDQYRTRIARTVVDWRGVEDEQSPPQAVPFTTDALFQLISVYPQSLHQIDRAILDVWYVLPEDLEKNLPTPPANGGTTTLAETDSSTTSSLSGPSYDIATGSEPNSAPSSMNSLMT